MRQILSSLIMVAFTAVACNVDPKESVNNDNLIHDLNNGLIKVVSEDLFTPPVASRIYAYVNLAAHEAVAPAVESAPSLLPFLHGIEALEPPTEDYDVASAVITAYTSMAKAVVYRGFLVDTLTNQMTKKYAGSNAELNEKGRAWGSRVAEHLLERAGRDGYAMTRTLPKYEILGRRDTWEPTWPTYGEALEPHWPKISPFYMDSVSQFRLPPPPPFDSTQGSPFHAAAMDVYQTVKASDSSDLSVAVFWDCNPGPTMVDGHVMKVRKQNTPPGHWMGIHTRMAMQQKLPIHEATYINAILMAGIADAVIAAWETKFHYHLLRPETFIQRYIDADWKAKLESPLFPEYASAHSSVSGVAASILDVYYPGQGFYDDTNMDFGLPPKNFDNVWQAAEEAAHSRYLGGIHYKFGCEAGLAQGKRLGAFIKEKLALGQ